MVAKRQVVSIPKQRIEIGLRPDEADRLALELAKMEAEVDEPGLGGFDVVDVDSSRERRRAWLETAMPAHAVDVGPFEIDVYPVTYGEWEDYAKVTGAAAPAKPGPLRTFVTGVSWREAQAFAQWRGCELPTEAEWECAARTDRRLFTWGDAYFPQGNIAFKPPVSDPYIPGSRPETASKRGVNDLLGQFGEYCADAFAPYPGADVALFTKHFPNWRGQRVVRGGYDPNQDSTCVSRRGVPEDERRTHLKFRCVRRG